MFVKAGLEDFELRLQNEQGLGYELTDQSGSDMMNCTRFALSFLFMVSLWNFSAVAQEIDNPMPSECTDAINKDLTSLEEQRESLSAEIAEVRVQLSELKSSSSADSEQRLDKERLNNALKDRQEKLIELIYEIECFRTDVEADSALVRAAGKEINFIEISTFYATNRVQSGNAAPASFYSKEERPGLEYGRAVVAIPTLHKPGHLELPTWWKFEKTPDPNKHFVLKSVSPIEKDKALDDLRASLAGAKDKSLLIFVHGFNVTFAESALRTAQLAHDLKFPGLTIFYSWPSAGRPKSYLHDEEMAALSEDAFDKLLDDVADMAISEIYIVAHSMGNRIVGNTIRNRVKSKKSVSKIRELFLAAPDINEKIFRRRIAPALAAMQGSRTTIYVSSNDIALKASKVVHEFRRVGESTGGVFTHPDLESIDTTGVAPIRRAFGHSYIVDSVKVIGDIEEIIKLNFSATDRGLPHVGAPPKVYWELD